MTERVEVPHVIDPPIPYKPGTEKATFGFTPRVVPAQEKIQLSLLIGIPLLVLLIGAIYSLATH